MNRLKELRKEKGLTQIELANIVNVSKITVLRWENGERQIKQDKAEILANFFGVQVPYLLGYSNFRTHYEEDFFYTTGYPISFDQDESVQVKNSKDFFNDLPKEQDKEARDRIEEFYLRFISDTEKLKALKSDALVAVRFIQSLETGLVHGTVKPYSYAMEMNKISSQLLDLIDRIDQREEELTS